MNISTLVTKRNVVSERPCSLETEPLPPPATYPPSIVYSPQNVQAPEEWQKLNYEEYDEENQVHRSDFTNFALSGSYSLNTEFEMLL